MASLKYGTQVFMTMKDIDRVFMFSVDGTPIEDFDLPSAIGTRGVSCQVGKVMYVICPKRD